MQCTTPSQRARLLACRPAAAAVLSAATLLGMAAPSATAQSDGWEHYEVAAPKTITLEFETDLLAFDLCWSAHTEMTKEQIANGVVAQMSNPAQLHVIDLPGLPAFYRRTSSASVWRDLNGTVITASDILPNRRDYHLDVEQALIDIAGRIREARPGAKLTFKGFELQPLPGGRPPAYEELGAVQDFYITDRTIYLNHVGHLLNHALNSTFFTARVNFASEQENWLVFPNQTGQFSLASLNNPDWPPSEFEPEILALWGGDGDDSGGGDEVIEVDDSVVLVPGSGFPDGWGEDVAAIGSPDMPGFDAKAIARWNVVPYQTVEDEPFSVGIVAFHINEIDRIEFYLEDGPAITVTEMTHNPRTDTWEYWAVLDPNVFLAMNHPDGPIELRAIAYPEGAGEPRVLEPLMLNTNAGQTLPKPVVWCAPWGSDETGDGSQENPFRQPYPAMRAAHYAGGGGSNGADGATVYLMPGEYHFGDGSFPRPNTQHRWATIAAAPGVSADQVIFTSSSGDGFKTNLTAVKDVTFDSAYFGTASGGPRFAWIDSARLLGPGGITDFSPFNSLHWNGIYITDSRITGVRFAARGASLVRGVLAENLVSDAFGDTGLVVNSRVHGIDKGSTDNHPDVYQFSGSGVRDNTIVYGLFAQNCRSQGIFADDLDRVDNSAFINVLIAMPLDHEPTDPYFSQWQTPTNHLLLHGVSIPNSTFRFRSPQMSNISVRGSHFYKITTASFVENEWFHGNHFTDTYTSAALLPGTDATVGNPQFTDFDSGNFTPLPNSPLRLRLSNPGVPVDINGEERSVPDTVGAIR